MSERPRELSESMAIAAGGDPGAIEALYAPAFGETQRLPRPAVRLDGGMAQAALVQAYRDRGYLAAHLDPLGLARPFRCPELDPAAHGLPPTAVGDLSQWLEAVYCGPIGWDFAHVQDRERRRWIEHRAEQEAGAAPTDDERMALLAGLVRAHAFETGLAARLPGAKLFGIGGAESFNVLHDIMLDACVRHGVEEVVVGGMHRGRFNMLANVFQKPWGPLVAEIIGKPAVPEGMQISSDVSYHLGYSGVRDYPAGRLRVSVSAHPSHLQLIPIISQGRARARQRLRGEDGARAVLPLLLHTDASFAGQGLVAEMFQLSRLAPFDLGGTIHVVINNQLGFTTMPEEGRSARGATDIARLVEAPVLHVNGDDPEAVWRVAVVAAQWRAAFASDIVIDLVCYRRPGHNEIDEPRFTQPAMYRAIDARPPVHEIYAGRLAGRGLETRGPLGEAERVVTDLKAAFEVARSYSVNAADWFDGVWSGFRAGGEADMQASPATGVALDELRRLGRILMTPPDGFSVDAKVQKFLDERRRTIETGEGITWATGEALAFATLLAEGTPVRFGGQDALRGAFTQRHWEIHDQTHGSRHLVLAPAARDHRQIEIHNTPLIEHAVLCYEYGVSLADPRRLVVWEAQFGEFLNIAQPVFDQCIACGEDRWLRSSGIVIFLPHGLDGGGPDHSTGRPERLLAACAGANLVVANVSAPANFFHLLRRQMQGDFRKPLVVLTPKALLRHKACVSRLSEMAAGAGFLPVIGDDGVVAARRVVVCTGKVYYDLLEERAERKLESEIALVRLEQIHPLPEERLRAVLAGYESAELVWCEEEPENMGYFRHLDRRLENLTGRPWRRAGRPAVATPSVGVKSWLEAEADALIDAALG